MSETSSAPTTREQFEALRIATATLEDGTTIAVRRCAIKELVLRQVLTLDFLQAWLKTSGDGDGAPEERIARTRAGLERLAIFAALNPPISETYDAAPSNAIWVDLLSLEDLGDIYIAVTGRVPVGPADAEAFRHGAASVPGAAASDGKGVRAETQQLDSGGSADPQHG